VWRALADHLHCACAPGPGVTGMSHGDAWRAVEAQRCEAIALHAGACTDSHAAGLLGVSRPEVRRLRRAR
jgi:hypothetical protein